MLPCSFDFRQVLSARSNWKQAASRLDHFSCDMCTNFCKSWITHRPEFQTYGWLTEGKTLQQDNLRRLDRYGNVDLALIGLWSLTCWSLGVSRTLLENLQPRPNGSDRCTNRSIAKTFPEVLQIHVVRIRVPRIQTFSDCRGEPYACISH